MSTYIILKLYLDAITNSLVLKFMLGGMSVQMSPVSRQEFAYIKIIHNTTMKPASPPTSLQLPFPYRVPILQRANIIGNPKVSSLHIECNRIYLEMQSLKSDKSDKSGGRLMGRLP